MKYTIVTVCLNAENTIKETMESVLQQSYKDFEYIIMDGMSNDATISIVEEYAVDQRVRLYQEKDTGLYNAMNKGIARAKGEYILFMNSGDVFADTKVLEDVEKELTKDLIYGDVIRVYSSGKKEESYKNKNIFMMLLMGKMMSHQSLFVKSDAMRRLGFDENYRITADYDMVVRAKANKYSFGYVNRVISIVENENGISSQIDNVSRMRKEDDKSLKRNFLFFYYITIGPKLLWRKIRTKV